MTLGKVNKFRPLSAVMSNFLPHKVFVYGSLLSSLGNHHILLDLSSHARLISDQCVTVEKFFLTGLKSNEYPYLSEVPLKMDQVAHYIKGELYEVSNDALSKLDWFEEHPVEYFRSMIEVRDLSMENGEASNSVSKSSAHDANVYLLKNDERIIAARENFDSKFVLVNGGDWRLHLKGL